MSTNTDIAKLDDLIVTTIDSIRGYAQAAEDAEAGRYAYFFREMAGERRAVLDRLQEASRALGGTPAEYGSVAGTIHRRFADIRRALGGGDEAILKEIERGEDYLKEEYSRALEDEHISPGTRAMIDHCFDSVMRGHNRSKHLRDALAEAS